MNAEQLNAIKERAAMATPGPWRSAGLYGVRTQNDEALSIPLRPSDATFIASSREDVPALVAEVERLREALEYYADDIRYVTQYDSDFNGRANAHTPIKEDNGNTAREALGIG